MAWLAGYPASISCSNQMALNYPMTYVLDRTVVREAYRLLALHLSVLGLVLRLCPSPMHL
jgi:hypothetical protein